MLPQADPASRNCVEVTVGEFAPLFLYPACELLPVAFNDISMDLKSAISAVPTLTDAFLVSYECSDKRSVRYRT
jgi:hypothetical protein